MDELRTLCLSCFRDYIDAGYILRLNGVQLFKGSCDLCGRPGFEYVLLEKERSRKGLQYEFD